MPSITEAPRQLDFGLKEQGLTPLVSAGYSAARQYVRDFQDGAINPEAWANIASAHKTYSKRILAFSESLQQAWDRQKKVDPSKGNPRVDYIEAIYREPRIRDSLRYYSQESEGNNLALVNDLLWIRTPDYYSSDQVRDELDEVYSEITPAAILEDEKDPGDVEHPSLSYVGTWEIMAKIFKGQISLKPSFKDFSKE